jgi:hypothetical protein
MSASIRLGRNGLESVQIDANGASIYSWNALHTAAKSLAKEQGGRLVGWDVRVDRSGAKLAVHVSPPVGTTRVLFVRL